MIQPTKFNQIKKHNRKYRRMSARNPCNYKRPRTDIIHPRQRLRNHRIRIESLARGNFLKNSEGLATKPHVLRCSKKSEKSLSKAITRNSNFSVARECKDPTGGGAKPPHPLGDHLHSLSNTREIRLSSDGLGKGFFGFIWKFVQGQKSVRFQSPELSISAK